MTKSKNNKSGRFTSLAAMAAYISMSMPAIILGEGLGEAITHHPASNAAHNLLIFLASLPVSMFASYFTARNWIDKSRKNQIIWTVAILLFCVSALIIRLFIYLALELPKR